MKIRQTQDRQVSPKTGRQWQRPRLTRLAAGTAEHGVGIFTEGFNGSS
jgi:hypothetical protein